ncbi:MAG: hypothetical protein U0798_11980 [Gemmataceae bacterium]
MPLGCREREEIRSYPIPKLADKPKELSEGITEYRLWGLIIPVSEGQSIFVKVQGPAKNIAAVETELDAFSKTIKFPNGPGKDPTWDLPAGWTEDRKNPNRIATLSTGKDDQKIQLAITKFGGDVIGNVNRWRGMVGAEPLKDSDPTKAAVAFKTNSGVDAYKVDVVGKKNPDDGGMPGMRMNMPRK